MASNDRHHPASNRPAQVNASNSGSSSLVDVLETVLDKGVVIAGDIKLNIAEVELLTIKIRLLVASVDKAEEMGIDWWRHDPHYSSQAMEVVQENKALHERIRQLEEANGTTQEEETEESNK